MAISGMRRISEICFGVEVVLEFGWGSCSKSVSNTKFSNYEGGWGYCNCGNGSVQRENVFSQDIDKGLESPHVKNVGVEGFIILMHTASQAPAR